MNEFARRDDVVVATNVHQHMHDGPGVSGLSRKAIMELVDASLTCLDTDYLDLDHIHRFDRETPVEETMEALHEVVKAGKARYLWASSMRAWPFAKMQHVAEVNGWTKFLSMQDQYSVMHREEEREMVGLLADQGVDSIPSSPLAGGVAARPWGDKSTNRAEGSADVDFDGRPLWLDTDKGIVDALEGIAQTVVSRWPRWRWPGC